MCLKNLDVYCTCTWHQKLYKHYQCECKYYCYISSAGILCASIGKFLILIDNTIMYIPRVYMYPCPPLAQHHPCLATPIEFTCMALKHAYSVRAHVVVTNIYGIIL